MSKQKRTSLTLEDRVKVLREGEKKSQRQLAVMFGVSKSQIQQVLKRKVETMNEYERNSNPKRKKLRFGSEYEDIDELTFRWFERARGSGTPISGPMIQCQAMEFAKNLHKSEFKASNGWLARFKNRHNIGSKILSGERASVDELTVDDWIGRLPAIIENHDEKNIYNVDETAFFLRALPEKTLAVRGTDSAGGKKSKERFTVVLCVNLLGDFETALFIGHSKKLRCFKKVPLHRLPVTWKSNKKALMTGEFSAFGSNVSIKQCLLRIDMFFSS